MKAMVKLTERSSWETTAFESITEKQTSEEEVTVAEVAAFSVELQVEVAEGKPKGNHLARYSNEWVSPS